MLQISWGALGRTEDKTQVRELARDYLKEKFPGMKNRENRLQGNSCKPNTGTSPNGYSGKPTTQLL